MMDGRYQEFRPFTVSGHEKLSLGLGTLYAKNTGDTLKLFAVSNHTTALLGGGPLNVDYEFVEMHFHWGEVKDDEFIGGSEHSIDGHKYPIELHMVHRNIHDEEVAEALEHENGLTVLGFKFQVVGDDAPYHSAMDTLADIAGNFLTNPGDKFSQLDFKREYKKGPDVNVVNFLPVLMDEYFHYHGSLTTGGCEESVNWVVFKNPLAIKVTLILYIIYHHNFDLQESHLRAFQSLLNKKGENIANNFRQTQLVNER